MQIDVTSPFPFEALPRIWKWIETFKDKVSDDFGPQALEAFVAFAAAKWETQKTWAIHVDGELGGLITFERLSPWLGTAHWIFKPSCHGRGIAAQASRIAVAQMFSEGIGKLAVYPLSGNVAIGSLLVSLGAKREGTLIAQTLCNGKPTDIWVYGLTKQQFEDKQHAVSSSTASDIRRDRSGIVDSGQHLRVEAQDHHHDQHADAHAADAADDGSALELQHRRDG